MSDGPEWYLYLAAVRSRSPRQDGRWKDSLRAQLEAASWRDCLGTTGELRDYGSQPIGRYQLLEVGEVEARWGEAPWFELDSPCGFVGPVSGFLNWESWMDARTGVGFAKDVLWATRGYLARIDRLERFEGIVEQAFPLREAASDHGFHDGDFFFRDVPDYAGHVRARIAAALAVLGLEAEFLDAETSHNQHRINQFVPRKKQTYAAAWQTFREHENEPLSLWGYNWTGMQSPGFTEFLAPPG